MTIPGNCARCGDPMLFASAQEFAARPMLDGQTVCVACMEAFRGWWGTRTCTEAAQASQDMPLIVAGRSGRYDGS